MSLGEKGRPFQRGLLGLVHDAGHADLGGHLCKGCRRVLPRKALPQLLRFVESEAFAKICAAQQVLRELPFITALPAGAVLAAQGHEELPAAADAQVLVQGIADLVLVYPDHLELLDYKTDRRKAESDFLRAYRAQLNLYAIAIEKRFAPKKVTYKGIYSFALGKLIEA